MQTMNWSGYDSNEGLKKVVIMCEFEHEVRVMTVRKETKIERNI